MKSAVYCAQISNRLHVMREPKSLSFKDAIEATAYIDTTLSEYMDSYTKEEVYKMLHSAAEEGNPIMQQFLGLCCSIGYGCETNQTNAQIWWEKAAEQGEYIAQYCLGISYYEGDGVPQNYRKAVFWFRKAADQELDDAQYMLGECYYWGNGVRKNIDTAIEWYKKAAENGNQAALSVLSQMFMWS